MMNEMHGISLSDLSLTSAFGAASAITQEISRLAEREFAGVGCAAEPLSRSLG